MDRHIKALITLLGNHLSHVEEEMSSVAVETAKTNQVLTTLAAQLDRVLLQPKKG
jgi:hypothetical protein